MLACETWNPVSFHSERFENALGEKVTEGHARSASNQYAEDVGGGRVHPLLAGLGEERQRRQAPQPFVAIVRRVWIGWSKADDAQFFNGLLDRIGAGRLQDQSPNRGERSAGLRA
jgi:hypothetical protein